MADATADDLAAGIAAMSLQTALNDDVLAAIALEFAALDLPDSFHRDNHGRGAPEIAAMAGVCRSWRRVLVATDTVWLRMIEARYPRLRLGANTLARLDDRKSRELACLRLTFREHFLVQADVERLRTAPKSVPPRSPGNHELKDFTFTLEAKCGSWRQGVLEWDEDDRKHYPQGTWESWTGTFEGFGGDHSDRWSDKWPVMGTLQIEDIEAFVSVYVTTPTLQTFKIYFDGTHDDSDDWDGDLVDFFTEQPMPYAYEQWTYEGGDQAALALRLRSITGQVALSFTESFCDEQLENEDVLTYLCGEAIPAEKFT